MAMRMSTVPPSVVAQRAKEEENEPQKMSREDWRKEKELEEARKAGTVPAMKDEEGKDINPHIPQYIMQAPWYVGIEHPTLKHQRPQEEKQKQFTKLGTLYQKGAIEGKIATKFRKGACENCGAMTHKKKDCLERPRKIGARFSGENFAPDEHVIPDMNYDFEGKRDRWNGYDPNEHTQIFEEFEKIEEAKRYLKEQKLEESILESEESKNTGTAEADAGSDNEDKYADDVDMPGQKFETKQRITVRNLRIREDTAKYLYNLDVNSAFYDPKTRSLRGNPFKGTGKEEGSDGGYGGDNFVRFSGDAHKFATKQVFAWEAYERGTDVHLQADPTRLELLSREVEKRKEDFKTNTKDSILAKYGGEEHLESVPKQLLLAQTEDYVEYSRTGAVLKGQEKAVVRSKYEEDVYINNHTSVWGSFWKNGRWGYKCCHACIKESYCTGEKGKLSSQENLMLESVEDSEEVEKEMKEAKSLLQQHQEKLKEKDKKKRKKKRKKKQKKKDSSSSSSEDSDSDEKEKARKLKEALRKEEEHQRKAADLMKLDERKRPYNSMYDAQAPTEEEMEAWRMKQRRADDPMAHFLTN